MPASGWESTVSPGSLNIDCGGGPKYFSGAGKQADIRTTMATIRINDFALIRPISVINWQYSMSGHNLTKSEIRRYNPDRPGGNGPARGCRAPRRAAIVLRRRTGRTTG